MMIQAVLSNADHPEYGVATIPFPIPKEQYDQCIEMVKALEIGDPFKKDCKVVAIDSAFSGLKITENLRVNLDELDYLAKRLESFDVGEAAQFQAMASKLELFELKDLINLTFCCQQATVITDFSDLEAIGRDHYMNLHGGGASVQELEDLDGVETAILLIDAGGGTITRYGVVYDNGMKMNHLKDYVLLPNINSDTELGRFLVDSGYKDFPEEVQPYLDYRAIGAEYYADNGGAYGPGGYVRRKSSLEQEPVRRDAIITLHMATPTIYNFTVSLPATEEELEDYKYRLGVDNFVQAKIIQVEYSKPYLADLVPKDGICVEDANELALCIEEMQQRDGELLKFFAVLSVEQPETMSDALSFAINLDDYERITEGTYEYGQSVLRRHGADDELLEAMDGYMNFEKLGEDAMVEDGVRETEFGLVRRCSHPFPEQEQTQSQQMFQ